MNIYEVLFGLPLHLNSPELALFSLSLSLPPAARTRPASTARPPRRRDRDTRPAPQPRWSIRRGLWWSKWCETPWTAMGLLGEAKVKDLVKTNSRNFKFIQLDLEKAHIPDQSDWGCFQERAHPHLRSHLKRLPRQLCTLFLW